MAKHKNHPYAENLNIGELRDILSNDPLGYYGAAQINNQDDMPLYRCCVLGRFWFFVFLNKQKYAVSKAYDASQDDIYEMVAILEKVKHKVEKYFHLENSSQN